MEMRRPLQNLCSEIDLGRRLPTHAGRSTFEGAEGAPAPSHSFN